MRYGKWRVRIKTWQANNLHWADARYNGSILPCVSSTGQLTRADAIAMVKKQLAALHDATAKYKDTTHDND